MHAKMLGIAALVVAMGLQGCLVGENSTLSQKSGDSPFSTGGQQEMSSTETSSSSVKGKLTVAILSKFEGEKETCSEYYGKSKDLFESMMEPEEAGETVEKVSSCDTQSAYGKCDYVVTQELVDQIPEAADFLGERFVSVYYINSINSEEGFGNYEELRAENSEACTKYLKGKWTNY
jgi:hypothetical protein